MCIRDRNRTRGLLKEFNEFTTQFFLHGTDKGMQFIVNTMTCVERVGKKTFSEIKEITDEILDCAGLSPNNVYIFGLTDDTDDDGDDDHDVHDDGGDYLY